SDCLTFPRVTSSHAEALLFPGGQRLLRLGYGVRPHHRISTRWRRSAPTLSSRDSSPTFQFLIGTHAEPHNIFARIPPRSSDIWPCQSRTVILVVGSVHFVLNSRMLPTGMPEVLLHPLRFPAGQSWQLTVSSQSEGCSTSR